MSIALGIVVIVVGAILRFAVTSSPSPGLNVHIVGVILMIAGTVGIVLSRLLPRPWRSNRPHRRSRQDAIDDHSLIVDGPPFYDGSSTAARRSAAARRSPQHPE